ncbi:eukaryotic translation initiation factor 2D-like [Saccostrea echinata]|uniref:eukaryotic translation initiation factor 2D-like n=1 Tax=Saccostrea echinata TaxID=191078 RepID=UPI002A82AE4F|nr:eukaryotic translation initiation factor 2D-like [Saccostrea echinata]
MFLKPFRVKTQTSIKGSDRKKVKSTLQSCYPSISTKDACDIVPNKAEMTIAKINTHSGVNVLVYCVEKNPVLIDVDGVVFPSVYTLWKYPDLLPVFRTHPPVFTKLAGGADLMLPGVVVEGDITPKTFAHIDKGTVCSISLVGNRSPVAVGTAVMSGSDMFDSAMRGKGIHVLHILGDELWAFGDKSKPPLLPEEPQDTAIDTASSLGNESKDSNTAQVINLSDPSQGSDQCEEGQGPQQETAVEDIPSEKEEDEKLVLSADKLSLEEEVPKEETEEEVPKEDFEDQSPAESMDDLFKLCFQCALKKSLKPADLPVLTSAFYKVHMVKFCPADKHLDVKKTSFKKLSKFLKEMEKLGYVKVKELTKGVESITEMNKDHPELRHISPPEGAAVLELPPEGPTRQYEPPRITDMLSVTAAVISLVKDLGLKKGSAITGTELRNIVNEYVRKNNLQDENNKSMVKLDPLLASIVLGKGENDVTQLRWDDLTSRIANKMQNVYKVEFPGQTPIIRKGKIEEITLNVFQRGSNKKVTTVDNLEVFGLDLKEIAHEIQITIQCSCTVSTSSSNKTQVVIQGNQIAFVTDLLTGKYRIPKKYIKGWEKAPKGKRK